MQSVLPTELESKRVTIAKKHNQSVLTLLAVLFIALFLLILIVRHGSSAHSASPSLIIGLLVVIALEALGIRQVLKQDNELCQQLGFMCPHCHQPLYEPRSFININGRCPKCRKSILS
jgi:hypothetical protein